MKGREQVKTISNWVREQNGRETEGKQEMKQGKRAQKKSWIRTKLEVTKNKITDRKPKWNYR